MISIWEKETFFATQDVIIVGSGFTGLWSAFYLKKAKPEWKITIVESGLIPKGASTKNAGIACFGSLSEVVKDAQVMGTDTMLEMVDMRYKGLERIKKYFTKDVIDFDLCGGYELYNDADELSHEQLLHNIEYINSLLKPITGSKKTFRPADGKIESFGFGKTKHMVMNNHEGYLHSGKLVCALLQKVQGMGVQVFNDTTVYSYEANNECIEIKTNKPFSLSTRQLLICTNFAKDLLPGLDIVPARGQILLTSPIDDLPWKGSFHSDEGFFYFRNLGKRVLLGGARNQSLDNEATAEFNTSPIIQTALEYYLANVILPHTKSNYSIESRWSGIMGMGSEKMPIIQKTAANIFCAVRMSGIGVALAPIAAKKVVQMMLDEL